MTILLSTASASLIVMTVDSSVALDFDDHREYREESKVFPIQGVGCVTTWGARDHNDIIEFLRKEVTSPDTLSIEAVADLVEHYLTKEYRPDQLALDDVGYHVAGFGDAGHPRLYHIFWGFDRPKPSDQKCRKYDRYDHSPPLNEVRFLYNGRNDLADFVVKKLLSEIARGRETRFDLNSSTDLALFGDFVARFAAELTPEVGPPFYTFLISPENQLQWIKNNSFCPVAESDVVKTLEGFGLRT